MYLLLKFKSIRSKKDRATVHSECRTRPQGFHSESRQTKMLRLSYSIRVNRIKGPKCCELKHCTSHLIFRKETSYFCYGFKCCGSVWVYAVYRALPFRGTVVGTMPNMKIRPTAYSIPVSWIRRFVFYRFKYRTWSTAAGVETVKYEYSGAYYSHLVCR